jgi:hypothetical protein
MQRIEIGLVEGRGVLHGIAHAGHLELVDLGPQLRQVGHRVGREDIHGAAHPADALQGLGFAHLMTRSEGGPAVVLIGHLHLGQLFVALGAILLLQGSFN